VVKISDPDVNQDKIFAAIDKIHHVQLEPDQQAEVIETSVINAAADLGEYELTILELYTQMGTVRAVAQQTGINYTNIHRTLKFCKTVIKQKIQKNAFI
jgi:predicted transcriptional regulator